MQSLLPGLTFGAEQATNLLNDARLVLGLPPVRIETGERRGRKRADEPYNPEIHEASAPSGKGPPARTKQMSKKARQKLGASTRKRWAIVKEAGIDTGGKIPSAAHIARAQRIMARRSNVAS